MNFFAKVLFVGVVIQALTAVGCWAHGTDPVRGKLGYGTRESWIYSMFLAFLYVAFLAS